MPIVILCGPEPEGQGTRVAELLAPRLDYELVAELLDATVVHSYPPPSAVAGPKLWRVARSFGRNQLQALALLRRLPPNTLVYSTGETWGLPFALAARALHARVKHVVYVHRVFSPRWLRALGALRSFLRVDGWICVTRRQQELLRDALGDDGRVEAISQGVDTQFWDPAKASPAPTAPYILSVGTEMRDYELLFDAVRGLDLPVVVKASSAWMRGVRRSLPAPPPNVRILTQRLSYTEMRDLYAGAALVVVPLLDTPQAAGITTILEAMAMGQCVVATESRGLPDVLLDGMTGAICRPNVEALREALSALVEDEALRSKLAAGGNSAVQRHCDIETHAQYVVNILCAVGSQRES